MAFRVLVAQFMHETNTFSKLPTTLDDYRRRFLVEGGDMVPKFKGARNEIGASMVASRRAAIFSSETPASRPMRSCWKTS